MKLHKIADLYVGIDYRYNTMTRQAPKYETDEKPEVIDIVIWSPEESVLKLKETYPSLSEDDCEYLLTGSSFYNCLIDFDGLMIHSSAVVYKGNAYLFSADSGTGKSTHTQLWRKVFGDEAKILNDDKPAVRIFDDSIYAYGTPWSGKTDWSENIKAHLKGICFIHRSETNEIHRVHPSEIVQDFLKQTVRPADENKMNKMLDNLNKLLEMVPVYTMGCNISPEAALLAYETMK